MSKEVLDRLAEVHPEAITHTHSQHGDETAVVKRESLLAVVKFLRDDPACRMEMLTDLTVVDYLGKKTPRFELVCHLYSLSYNHRVRVKVEIEESSPEVDSLNGLYKSAYWMEREAYDLYGVHFEGHPDLRRLLLYPEFEGHPLRKDYELEHRQPRIPPREGFTHR